MTVLRNIVVVGGSYVGYVNAAQQLATSLAGHFRVLLIEKHSHFQHLFAFPRFAVATGVDTRKAFIPFVPGTFAACPPGSGSFVQAEVTGITKEAVQLDRKVTIDGQQVNSVPYSYLVIATGTKLTPPSTIPVEGKMNGVDYLQKHAQKVISSSSIVLIGGGAVGVQMATDIKELYPEKSVTLVHSRKNVMNKFDPRLHNIIAARCKELGIQLRVGSRVKLPPGGYPTDGSKFDVELEDGSKIPADFAIIATGQTPNSGVLRELSLESIGEDSFIKVSKTLQIVDERYPNVFAIGDVAATGAHKAARPAARQAALVIQNVQHLLNNEPLEEYEIVDPPAIHMTLGITKNVVFANPRLGSSEPVIKHRDDGSLDMNIDGVWERRGGGANPLL
ncbi:FAD/NAD-P-binding domain-containing protein [Acephala macrosclerotiorum]|nr:FAD/NAD-P-binding domain-containing protein [Acephala macrosclerotiorum]